MPSQNWILSLPTGIDTSGLRRALGAALGINPVDVCLKLEGDRIPTVVVTVEDGKADICAVSGAVKIVLADMDREGENLSREEIDSILDPDLYTGTSAEVEEELAKARDGLERYLESVEA